MSGQIGREVAKSIDRIVRKTRVLSRPSLACHSPHVLFMGKRNFADVISDKAKGVPKVNLKLAISANPLCRCVRPTATFARLLIGLLKPMRFHKRAENSHPYFESLSDICRHQARSNFS